MILKLLQVYELLDDPKGKLAYPEDNLVSPESESDWTILYIILTDFYNSQAFGSVFYKTTGL